MAERSNAAVLKTVDCNRSGGSNPSLSADNKSKYFNACILNDTSVFIFILEGPESISNLKSKNSELNFYDFGFLDMGRI